MFSRRRPLLSPKQRRLRARRRRGALVALGALFLVALGALVYAARLPRFLVTNIRFVGKSAVAEDDLRAEVEKVLGGYYLLLVPRRNAFLYPRVRIEGDLKETFPRLASVRVVRESLTAITVTLRDREEYALWCEAEPAGLSPHPDCFYLDATGFLFAHAPELSGFTFLEFTGGLSDETRIGARLLPEGEFVKLLGFLDELKGEGFRSTAVRIDDYDYTFTFNEGTRLLAARSRPFDETFANIRALIEANTISADTLPSIDYVDTRFGNKVFYRPRGE